MRGATECAKRLKSFFGTLRSKLGKVSQPTLGDPVTQLLLGILSRDTLESKAAEGLDRLRGMVVDYNELRVIPPLELAEALHDFPDARLKAEDVSRALNSVFAREHTVSLERLADWSKRDALAYLQKIDGLEPYTVARIRLLGLRHHAIPLDEAMWAAARAAEIVNARCPLDEAQQFIERQIPEESALEFVALLKKHAWDEHGAAVRKARVARITSTPPDRTTRNMLQMVAAGLSPDLAGATDAEGATAPGLGEDEDTLAEPVRAEDAPSTSARKAAARRAHGKAAASKASGGRPSPQPAAPKPKSRKADKPRARPSRPAARKAAGGSTRKTKTRSA